MVKAILTDIFLPRLLGYCTALSMKHKLLLSLNFAKVEFATVLAITGF